MQVCDIIAVDNFLRSLYFGVLTLMTIYRLAIFLLVREDYLRRINNFVVATALWLDLPALKLKSINTKKKMKSCLQQCINIINWLSIIV